MKPSKLQKRLWLPVTLLLLFCFVNPPVGAAPSRDSSADYIYKISNGVLQATAQEGSETSFIIFLQDQADLSAAYSMQDQDARGWYVYNTLKEVAAHTQAPIIDQLEA
jgi:hypothetical protein